VDFLELYAHGKLVKRTKDEDSDGRFEMTQWFNRPEWAMVMERDVDHDGFPETRSFFEGTYLKKKEIDNNSDNKINRREFYNENGKIIRIENDEGSTGIMNMVWYYNSDEEAIKAEKDGNLDGKIDVWFHYRNSMVTSVEEDTNFDGNPDLWETYDKSEALVQRKRDLDYDGTPDVIEENRQVSLADKP
jgi:hypothetical protein